MAITIKYKDTSFLSPENRFKKNISYVAVLYNGSPLYYMEIMIYAICRDIKIFTLMNINSHLFL